MEKILGVVHYALYPQACSGSGDVTRTFDAILQDGSFRAIEVTWIKDATVRRKAARILRASGVHVMFSAGPALLPSGLSLSSTDSLVRRRAVDFTKNLVEMGCELDSHNLLLSSGPDPGEQRRHDAVRAFEESLDEVCAYAVEQRPTDPPVICLEPFDREIQFRQLVGPTRLAARIVANVRKRYSNCGITLDMSHVAQLREGIEEAVDAAADCLVHAHIANCVLVPGHPLFGDAHPSFDVPEGAYRSADIMRYIRTLERSGFFMGPCPYGSPVVSVEIKPVAGQDPVRILQDFKASLDGWPD